MGLAYLNLYQWNTVIDIFSNKNKSQPLGDARLRIPRFEALGPLRSTASEARMRIESYDPTQHKRRK